MEVAYVIKVVVQYAGGWIYIALAVAGLAIKLVNWIDKKIEELY